MKILLTIILAFYLSCGGGNQPSQSPNVRNGVQISTQTQQTTAKGVHVYSQGSLPPSSLNLIDAGLDRVFANATADGYTQQIGSYNYFTVDIPVQPCQLSPVWKLPAFKVRADNYDGTEYDTNPAPGIGEVLADEMVVGGGEMIVCPEEQYLADEVNNGAEHQLIQLNDPIYYEQTKTHLTGGHPLLPHPTNLLKKTVLKLRKP